MNDKVTDYETKNKAQDKADIKQGIFAVVLIITISILFVAVSTPSS